MERESHLQAIFLPLSWSWLCIHSKFNVRLSFLHLIFVWRMWHGLILLSMRAKAFSLISCLHSWTMIWRLKRATKGSWPLAQEHFKHQSASTCSRKRSRFSIYVIYASSAFAMTHYFHHEAVNLIGSRSECPMILLDLIKDSLLKFSSWRFWRL